MGPHAALLKTVGLLALMLAAPVRADDFADMVKAEQDFASDASARNTRDAFLAALADDGVVFAPGPSNGKRVWEARAANHARLEWAPAVAEIAAGGDLGYTSGPWCYTAEGATKPSAFGQYFTVWQKQADGHWKALIDHGVSGAQMPFPDKTLRRGAVGVGHPPTWPVGMAELRTADLSPPGALNPRLVSADFLRLRNGLAPDGRAEGKALPSTAQRLDTGQVVSKAGDLGVTWGGGAGSPAWLRVWRRPSAEDAPGLGWQLAADVVVPAPAGEP